MADNIVSYIMRLLTPELVGRIAGSLGLDAATVQRAITTAIPALLAGLAGAAAKPGGAEKLADAVRQQGSVPSDVVAKLAAGDGSLTQLGSGFLASLFGSGDSATVADAVSRQAGMDKNVGGSLLGMLAPLVLSGIGAKVAGDANPANLAGLLSSQKDNISDALPAGIKDAFAGTALLSGLGSTLRSVGSTASDATTRAASSASSITDAGTKTGAQVASRSSSWLWWLIALLVIAAALYYFLARPMQTPVATPEATAPAATQSLNVGGVDLGKQASDVLTGLQATLNGVTDAASAQTALPKLQAAEGELDKISATIGQLSAEQKSMLSALVKPLVPAINGLFDKVLAIPGVAEIIKPTIDSLKSKLATLAA